MDTKADAQLVEHFASRVPGVVSVYSTLRWRIDKPRLPRSDPRIPRAIEADEDGAAHRDGGRVPPDHACTGIGFSQSERDRTCPGLPGAERPRNSLRQGLSGLPQGPNAGGAEGRRRGASQGPTAAERRRRYGGWFSARTAEMLRSVRLSQGVAYIDFRDFRRVIPNASSSCGSSLLLAQLDRTADQFPTVRRAIYSFNGSRRAFYEWLQLSPP